MNLKKTEQASTILIVDDNLTNLDVLLDSLNDAGYRILIAENGEDALEQAEKARPDIVLLDVLMPGLNGFETCTRLKKQESTRHIPVIFMTALTDTESKLKGFDVGGVDYVTKPLEHQEVLARINTHLTIQRQQRQLRLLNANKDKFFSIIAHDLRGPLASLHEINEIAEENLETYSLEKLRQLSSLQRQSTSNLCELLENLLTWSRIQRGLIEYNPRSLDIRNVVIWNVKLFRTHADQKNVTLRSTIQENTMVYADLLMVDTIIRNLISNALKFTHPGGTIEISASSASETVEITVSDTGIGMKPENIARLFRIETQYKRSGTGGEKGTGLGLILCKEFVEKHGGEIWIESTLNKGTQVTFSVSKGEHT